MALNLSEDRQLRERDIYRYRKREGMVLHIGFIFYRYNSGIRRAIRNFRGQTLLYSVLFLNGNNCIKVFFWFLYLIVVSNSCFILVRGAVSRLVYLLRELLLNDCPYIIIVCFSLLLVYSFSV